MDMGEMYGKNNMETYITVRDIDSQQDFAVWFRELKQGLWINLEGLDGEGDGREVQKGEDICIPMAESCWGLTENNKILKSNYPSIKNQINKKSLISSKNTLTDILRVMFAQLSGLPVAQKKLTHKTIHYSREGQ